MEVQLRLLDEVKAMVTGPVMVVANKSDLVTADGYTTMSTADGTGVEEVLAELLTHKPIPEKDPHAAGTGPGSESTGTGRGYDVEYAPEQRRKIAGQREHGPSGHGSPG